MEPTTVRFERETMTELEEIAAECRVDRSEVIREAVAFALENAEESDREGAVELDAAPEWATLASRKKRTEKANKPNWWREGFIQRVRRIIGKCADGDPPMPPESVDAILDGYREEARLLFEDDPERLEAELERVDAELTEYRREWEKRDDARDGATYFGPSPSAAGDRAAAADGGSERERGTLEQKALDAVNRRLESGQNVSRVAENRDRVEKELSSIPSVSPPEARDAVDAALKEVRDV